ncbi:pyridoxal-phosphate dependent enzyme [Nannocystis pusilla]|uniref:Pyridoxal-phosphate dependent enzyme n=1 Tax=Nannocystis pusilla TaxID=889268 RepID=A0ABS7TLL5_9BACT|nr:pyridoxal-phosphate dependent enzyme [Nannocystis pusilla]MBZ5709098.1 pyridoxal-phosphate dependent enzyme [Nannocystis pusilla]
MKREHHLSPFLREPPARLDLATLPTPVERAPWLDAPGAEVYVKRDDQTSRLYGGGKVRKLEWLLANPPYDDRRPIVSVGGIGSHHLVALALHLREQGRELHAWVFDQVPTAHTLEDLGLLLSTGAKLWAVPTRPALPVAWLAYHTWARPAERGVYMPPGGTTGLSGLGFVEAGLELAQQVAEGALPAPQALYVTGGTCGSCCGLALGFALAGLPVRVRVVSALERLYLGTYLLRRTLDQIFAALVRAGLRQDLAALGPAGLLARAGVTWSIDHSQVGSGYAVPTAAGEEAVALAAGGGLSLETTYTGKCLAALRRDLAAGAVAGPVLFWDTHGATDLRPHIVEGWEARLPIALRRRLIRAGAALSAAR